MMSEQYYELSITADTNDADYVTATHKVTMEKIQALLPIIEVINKKTLELKNQRGYGHNFPNGEIGDPREVYSEEELTDEQIDLISDYLPYGEYGIHTITDIEYYPYPEKVRLL
jgi:hypothetical protein